jgi:hypothetical protein
MKQECEHCGRITGNVTLSDAGLLCVACLNDEPDEHWGINEGAELQPFN